MKKLSLKMCILIFILFFCFSFLMAKESLDPIKKSMIVVSILPQIEFVEKIAGDKFSVIAIVGLGSSPHNYEPTPQQILKISKAKAYFSIGIEFEKALISKIKASFPQLEIFEVNKNVKLRLMEKHSHENEHEEEGFDPHIWLGYEQVKVILTNVLAALIELDPDGKEYYEKNYLTYKKEIDETFDLLSRRLAPFKGKTVFVYHPAFGYFLDNFGLKQKSFEIRGKEPSQRQLIELIKEAKREEVKAIFVQKQFSKTSAKKIADAIKGKVIEVDPLDPNWLKNIKYMGEKIIEAFQ